MFTQNDVTRLRLDAADEAWTRERRDVLATLQADVDGPCADKLVTMAEAAQHYAFLFAHGHHLGAAKRKQIADNAREDAALEKERIG